MPTPEKETILFAALRVEAQEPSHKDVILFVARPGRHHDIIWTMARDGMNTPIGNRDNHTQGFVTSVGRFVGREEALAIARECGQFTGKDIGGRLYSEDLW